MLISICIPVYKGEQFLQRCLSSLASQTFKDFETIVVDDCSPGKDEKGWGCKKICRVFGRKNKLKINYVKNSRNLGCIGARRTAVYEAKGKYIFCLDCDDALTPDCLEMLAEKAAETNADIIQCGAKVVFAQDEKNQIVHSQADLNNLKHMQEKTNSLYCGELNDKAIFECSVIEQKINYFIWGKLISREVFLNAWELIPPCTCVWGEDYLMYFFVTYFSKKYIGISNQLYIYSVDTGISSAQKIKDLSRWEKICSASSVFAVIFDAINEKRVEINSNQKENIQALCNSYVLSNYRYYKYFVEEEIKSQAWKILNDYWGSEYLNKVLAAAGEKIESK